MGNIKARRCSILRLNTFDCLTDEERAYYNAYKKAKDKEKLILKQAYIDKVNLFDGIRNIPKKYVYVYKEGESTGECRPDRQVSLFESEIIRMADNILKDTPLLKQIIFLVCSQRQVLKQIIDNGVFIDDEMYVFHSATTNQMKNEMCILLQKSFRDENISKLMCGLTLEKINNNERIQGCNRGKYLAYNSLPMSSSVELEDYNIDIDRVMVIPDYSTLVSAKYNYLNVDTFKTEVSDRPIEIEHFDGCGMFLPETLPASCQIRGGWIKGCIFPFDFRRFIDEKENTTILIPDVYGDMVDVVAQDIRLLLTASQVKMWKYYKNWNEYKDYFKENHLSICINNIAKQPKKNATAHLQYQFLQTLNDEDVTNTRIENLFEDSLRVINGSQKNVEELFELLDINDDDVECNYLYAAIKKNPSIIKDVHVQRKILSKIRKEIKETASGKPRVKGFYSYICPDLYALCEIVFQGNKNPNGLIKAEYVYNSYYANSDYEEACCLRSPHLSDCEHAIKTLEKSDQCKKWFIGTDTIISIHDLTTKILQCDVDGDELLITPDKRFIDMVDRNKLPLVYDMGQAEPDIINNDVLYDCLCSSFDNSVIGDISNAITKLWNPTNGRNIDINFIRILTAYNNYKIDFPKTQYDLPLKEYTEYYEAITADKKYPYFFHWAKDKRLNQCNKPTNSIMDRICCYVNKNTKSPNIQKLLDEKEFNPQLYINSKIMVDRKSPQYMKLISLLYDLKTKENRIVKKIHSKRKQSESDTYSDRQLFYGYCSKKIDDVFITNIDFISLADLDDVEAAYLLDIEYYQEHFTKTGKDILWNCFGDIILKNIKENTGKELNVRKMAYISSEQKKKEIEAMVEESIIKQIIKTPIYENEYIWVREQKTKKGSEADTLLLFILLYCYKKYNKDGYFNLHLRSKQYGITRNTLDQWIGADISNKGIERLTKKGLISVSKLKNIWKIKVNIPDFDDEEKEEKFFIENGNPLIPYFESNGERTIKVCEICESKYIAEKNYKTCGKLKCSRMLELKNKNKIA